MNRPIRGMGMFVIALIFWYVLFTLDSNASGTLVPKTVVPKTLTPVIVVPEVVAEATLMPETPTPIIVVPEVVAEKTLVPETLMPDTVLPEVVAEKTLVPETLMPDAVLPEVVAEEIMPETLMPDTVVPEVVAEEIMQETLMPDTVVPEVVAEETLMPDIVVQEAMPVVASSETVSATTVKCPGFLSESYEIMNSYVQSFMTRVLAVFQPQPQVIPPDTERLLKAAQGGNTVVELSSGRHVAMINVGELGVFQFPLVLASYFFEFSQFPAGHEFKMEVEAARASKFEPPSVETPTATHDDDSVPQDLFSTLLVKIRSFVSIPQDAALYTPEELVDAERLEFAASNSWHSIVGLSGARVFFVLNVEAFGQWKDFVLALTEVLGFVKDVVRH